MAKLSDKQYAAIAILSMPKRNGMTYEQVAEEVGVTTMTLHRWRNNDAFNEELKRTIMRATTERLPEVMASIPDHIINDGNAALFRTLLQANGLLTDRQEVEVRNVGEVDTEAMKAQIEAFKQRNGSGSNMET